MRFIKQVILCLFVAALVWLSLARAQNTTGSVMGTVSDTGGAVVPNAKVTLSYNATGVQRKAQTSESGDYQLLNLPPGEYTFTVESPGFKRYVQKTIEVQVEHVCYSWRGVSISSTAHSSEILVWSMLSLKSPLQTASVPGGVHLINIEFETNAFQPLWTVKI